MRKSDYKYRYFVEGDNEKRLLKTLNGKMGYILSGKVTHINPLESKISPSILMQITNKSIVILLFDTDTNSNLAMLKSNIEKLKTLSTVKEVWCVMQVGNLEDELVYSCDKISRIEEFTKSKSKKDFKRDFIRISDLEGALNNKGFDIKRIWSRNPRNQFCEITNQGSKIKL